MSFDCSRFTFDPARDYLGVVMQQGRVQLDSEWNELVAELDRRIRAGTLDTIGRAVYPMTTPHAFEIQSATDTAGNHLTIGAGRMYVDGIMAENHGPPDAASWDPALAELSGASATPGAAPAPLDFTAQPYLPGAAVPTGTGPFLVYLDVWRRAVTALEDPDLIEKALGVDTTGRVQTVWQVKCLDVSTVNGVSTSTPDSALPMAWQALLAPPGATLSTRLEFTGTPGPCSLAPSTGYTGLENQLYRVEIHQPGPVGTATFKWSRDNGSVATAVTAIDPTGKILSVASTGKDGVLGFRPNDWVEITDDWLDLNGLPGPLLQIAPDGVDAAARQITLASPVTAQNLPYPSTTVTLDPTQALDPQRHPRLRRWDSDGALTVPADGTAMGLENGINVSFQASSASATLKTGDFWTFPARTVDGTVGPLTNAPPQGIAHHYARLALTTFPGIPVSCRVAWPPPAAGRCCACSVTVTPSDLADGNALQELLDRYQNLATSFTVCLAPGTYNLAAPLRLNWKHSNLTLRACQEGTVALQVQPGQEPQFFDGLIVLDGTQSFAVQGIVFSLPLAPWSSDSLANLSVSSLDPEIRSTLSKLVVCIGLRLVGCNGVTVRNCSFRRLYYPEGSDVIQFGVGIFANGRCTNLRLEGNAFDCHGAGFSSGFVSAPSVAFGSQSLVPAPTELRATKDPRLPAPAASAAVAPVLVTKPPLRVNAGVATPAYGEAGGGVFASLLDGVVFRENTFTRLTFAALLLAESDEIEFSDNQVQKCAAGFWSLAPLKAPLATFDAQGTAWLGLALALGYPLPQGHDTTRIPIRAPNALRIFAGSAPYTDTHGNLWQPDETAPGVSRDGGTRYQPNPPLPIAGTADDPLYQDERYGAFSYTFSNLGYGFYQVVLKFAEIWYIGDGAPGQTGPAGQRIFNVYINGQKVLDKFDINQQASGSLTACDRVCPDIPVTSGQLVVRFEQSMGSPDVNPKISAVAVVPQWSPLFLPLVAPPVPSSAPLAVLQDFAGQLIRLAQQGYAGLLNSASRWRVERNEMQGLTAPGLLVLEEDSRLNPKTSSLLLASNRIECRQPWLSPDEVANAFTTFSLFFLGYWLVQAFEPSLELELCDLVNLALSRIETAGTPGGGSGRGSQLRTLVRGVGASGDLSGIAAHLGIRVPTTQIPKINATWLKSQGSETPASTPTNQENGLTSTLIGLYQLPFNVLAGVYSVTRCVASANQIVCAPQTSAPAVAEAGISFALLDVEVPLVEIVVSGNLFCGSLRGDFPFLSILPPRFITAGQFVTSKQDPSPMCLWEFLNTVT